MLLHGETLKLVSASFFPAQRRSSFLLFCDLLSQWPCLTGLDPDWLTGKPPYLLSSFKSKNHKRRLSPFWQISTSSVGCDILLSVSFWPEKEGFDTGAMLLYNYITTSLEAPRPLTQLFPENVDFIVSFERMRSFRSSTRAQLIAADRPPTAPCVHACVREYIMSREWLWQT